MAQNNKILDTGPISHLYMLILLQCRRLRVKWQEMMAGERAGISRMPQNCSKRRNLTQTGLCGTWQTRVKLGFYSWGFYNTLERIGGTLSKTSIQDCNLKGEVGGRIPTNVE